MPLSAAGSLVLCLDIDCNSGFEVDGEVILVDRDLRDQALDQRFVELCDLMDFYDEVIIHTEDYSWPGLGTHYGVYTANHIIDVIADEEPIITRIE